MVYYGMRGGKQRILCPTYYGHSQITKISDVRSSDEAIESTRWKCRENVKHHVLQQSASFQCDFCTNYASFYHPKTTFVRNNNGHYTPKPQFYSNVHCQNSPKQATPESCNAHIDDLTCSNISLPPQSPPLQFNSPTPEPIEYKISLPSCFFQYFHDPSNPRSQQEVSLDDKLWNGEFLMGEGIPKKIITHFEKSSHKLKIRGSLSTYIFKNTNVPRYRLFRQLTSTQNLIDVSYRQFSVLFKDFIHIFVLNCTNSFLQKCIDNDIVPKKYRKNITLNFQQRTKTIRKDCMNLSKHLMENDIRIETQRIEALNTKVRGYIWNLCRKMRETAKNGLYQTLLDLRNTCAFVCGVGHTRKINALVQCTTHICVTASNVLDVAVKKEQALVQACNIPHFHDLYWTYREYTLEKFRLELLPLQPDGGDNVTNTLPEQIRVWENYLARVTASKSLLPGRGHIEKDWRDNWNKFLYGFRWGQNLIGNTGTFNCSTTIIDQNHYIPWQKPSVTLPARANPESEIFLATLKLTINEQFSQLWDDYESINDHNNLTQHLLQQFLDANDFRVVSSDKTNRCLLMDNTKYIDLGEKFLTDSADYLRLSKDPNRVILDRVNSLINAIKKTSHTFKKGDLDRLIKYNPSPAKLSFLVKDHKQQDSQGNFPLRPLANINGSSLDSLDWILAKILNQGVKLVKYHIWNSQQVLQLIPRINSHPIREGYSRAIISLDVVGLYPSIPTLEATGLVFRYIKEHPEVNTFGIPYSLLREIMNTIANNYNVEFNGRVYKQTKGVAMGGPFFLCVFCNFHVSYRILPGGGMV